MEFVRNSNNLRFRRADGTSICRQSLADFLSTLFDPQLYAAARYMPTVLRSFVIRGKRPFGTSGADIRSKSNKEAFAAFT